MCAVMLRDELVSLGGQFVFPAMPLRQYTIHPFITSNFPLGQRLQPHLSRSACCLETCVATVDTTNIQQGNGCQILTCSAYPICPTYIMLDPVVNAEASDPR